MILAIDIGNTNITCGIFRGSNLISKLKVATYKPEQYFRALKKIKQAHKIKAIIVCSVVPSAERRLISLLKKTFKTSVTVLGKDAKVPIRNLYKNPRQVGQDRLVAAYAALTLYGAPCVIIDFGTAVTFDVVSKKGAYLGGLIVPGMELSLNALSRRAALLPKIELKKPSFILGKTTAESMSSGAFYGYAAMCDGLVGKLTRRFRCKFNVIATGGNARLILPLSNCIAKADENLILKGLNLIFLNPSKKS